MATPYITPEMLVAAPTGIDWGSLGGGTARSSSVEDICWRGSADADNWCEQDLRATINTEQEEGPSFRVTIRRNGNARMVLSRFPVLSVLSLTVLPSGSFTSAPQVVPAGQYRILSPLLGELGNASPGSSGVGPNAIEIAAGWIDWSYGRHGWIVAPTYVNGWPHAGLTAAATAGANTIAIDDCTGMVGCAPTIYDGRNTETVTVLSTTATSGPGLATLAVPLLNAHNAGVLVTTLSPTAQEAVIYFCMAQALQKGAVSVSAPAAPSRVQSSGPKATTLREDARKLLTNFRRVI